MEPRSGQLHPALGQAQSPASPRHPATRRSALLSHAASQTFAATPSSLKNCPPQHNVDNNFPPSAQLLAESPLTPPHLQPPTPLTVFFHIERLASIKTVSCSTSGDGPVYKPSSERPTRGKRREEEKTVQNPTWPSINAPTVQQFQMIMGLSSQPSRPPASTPQKSGICLRSCQRGAVAHVNINDLRDFMNRSTPSLRTPLTGALRKLAFSHAQEETRIAQGPHQHG